MAHPKRKISKQRRNKRRTHIKLTPRPFYLDPETGEPTLLHRVCLESGHYRGRQVIEAEEDF